MSDISEVDELRTELAELGRRLSDQPKLDNTEELPETPKISEYEFLEPLASDVKEKLPEELEEAWERLLLDREPEKLRRALRLYLSGSASVDDAAAAAHVDSRRVRLWLRRLAVYSPAWASKAVMNAHKRVALLALEELEKRMLSPAIADEKKFHPMTLNALAGTSTDKVARGEGWGQEKPEPGPTYASALEKLAEGLRQGQVSLKIEVAKPERGEFAEIATRTLPP